MQKNGQLHANNHLKKKPLFLLNKNVIIIECDIPSFYLRKYDDIFHSILKVNNFRQVLAALLYRYTHFY